MTATKGIAALLMAAIVSVAVPGPALANKPLVGVACGGGFYVRAPTKKIYWIHGDPLEKTVVHDGPAKLAALAECGPGTVAVFQDRDDPTHSRIFYSEDCLNIGAASGHTRLVDEATEPVTTLSVKDGRLIIGLASGTTLPGVQCQPG